MSSRSHESEGAGPKRSAPLRASAEDLAIDAQGGCAAAFTDLVERFESPLFNFLRLRAYSIEDAEELTQETFLRAWQQLRRYSARWRFSTWLFTLGKRLTASRYRKLRRDIPGSEPPESADLASEPSQLACEREERANLWDLASRVLSVEQRSAIWLRYAEGLSVREIGEVLARREPTVRVILFRARERLAKGLAEVNSMTPKPLPEPARALYPPHLTAQSLAGGR
jgi:RNA polymerase sigma-70 factor (ECF subfamily)